MLRDPGGSVPATPPLRRRGGEDGRSDADLVAATRAGDREAYAVLWRRHVGAARMAARAVTSSIDADDLVSESFARIFKTIGNGSGPGEAFRPYLYTTIRHVAATWGRQSAATVGLESIDDLADERHADPATQYLERTTLVRAFQTLPERWRSTLWYLEVEGMAPREIAPLLGMTPNAVAALAYRAREGFRRAWLDIHTTDRSATDECRWALERLGRPALTRLPATERRRLAEHLTACASCQVVAAKIDPASGTLRTVLLPSSIGITAGAALSTLLEQKSALAPWG